MPPSPEAVPTPKLLDGRTLFVRTAVGIGLLLVGMAAIGVWIREPAIRASRTFIECFTPGYLQRVESIFPKQGTHEPWVNPQDYSLDRKRLTRMPLEDGVMQFG